MSNPLVTINPPDIKVAASMSSSSHLPSPVQTDSRPAPASPSRTATTLSPNPKPKQQRTRPPLLNRAKLLPRANEMHKNYVQLVNLTSELNIKNIDDSIPTIRTSATVQAQIALIEKHLVDLKTELSPSMCEGVSTALAALRQATELSAHEREGAEISDAAKGIMNAIMTAGKLINVTESQDPARQVADLVRIHNSKNTTVTCTTDCWRCVRITNTWPTHHHCYAHLHRASPIRTLLFAHRTV